MRKGILKLIKNFVFRDVDIVDYEIKNYIYGDVEKYEIEVYVADKYSDEEIKEMLDKLKSSIKMLGLKHVHGSRYNFTDKKVIYIIVVGELPL